MKVSKAGKIRLDYHQIHSKKIQLDRTRLSKINFVASSVLMTSTICLLAISLTSWISSPKIVNPIKHFILE